MKRSVLTFLFLLIFWGAAIAQQAHKGLPTDLDKSELIIIKYEPEDLIPADARSYSRIYVQTVNLPAKVAEANATLEKAAKNGYPYQFRLISREELLALPVGKTCYVFQPGLLPYKIGAWNTIPLYLQNNATQELYETGSIQKSSIYSAEKVMEQFLKAFQKNL